MPTRNAGPRLQNFADTAALIENLDLVISVDTAVAHLSGALGRPCWLLLPDYMADWRWRSEGDDSAWYPGALRLFRQPGRGDWATVVARVAQALRLTVSEKTGAPAASPTVPWPAPGASHAP